MRKVSLVVLALAATINLLPAATPSIGVALSSGSMTVDNSLVPGNATLFDGNTIETGATSSRLQMKNGKLAELDADSAAKVYSDHMVLQRGSGEASGSYGVVAKSLRITGDSARVSVSGNTVEVAALSSPVLVSTSAGLQVANLMPGRALAFTPQDSGAMAPATVSGCLRKVGEALMLTDTTSNVTVQLTGGGIEKYEKHLVSVTGTPAGGATPAAGATQVLTVTNVTDQGKGKKCAAGPGAGAMTAAGAGAAAAGAGVGATTAAVVIAGVAVAATIGVSAGVLATQTTSTTQVCLSACPQ
jgi:hypothetical protein